MVFTQNASSRRRHRGPRRRRLADLGTPALVRDWREDERPNHIDPALLRGLTQPPDRPPRHPQGGRARRRGRAASPPAASRARPGRDERRRRRTRSRSSGPARPGTGHVNFANWPLYMDPKHPELKKFTAETGITVKYKEVINDLPTWFAKIQPQLAAHQSIGYDIMVITNGSSSRSWSSSGFYAPLDHTQAAELHRERGAEVQAGGVRPGQRLQRAVGVRHHRHRLQPEVRQDAADQHRRTCGTRRTRARSACSPTPRRSASSRMLAVGVDPEKSTPADWQQGRRLAQAAAATPASSASTTTRTTSARWPTATSG